MPSLQQQLEALRGKIVSAIVDEMKALPRAKRDTANEEEEEIRLDLLAHNHALQSSYFKDYIFKNVAVSDDSIILFAEDGDGDSTEFCAEDLDNIPADTLLEILDQVQRIRN